MTFEKWWETEVARMKQGEGKQMYFADKVYPGDLKRAWDAAWQAATIAERERAAKVAEKYEPQGYTDGYDAACIASYNIAAAIRKGEGV